jgi:F-type H+-transporting ATPase subunit b
MLQLDPGMMIWTWITFLVVLLILYKIALKPILKAIEDREISVRTEINEAKRQRDEAEALLTQHKRMMAEAESQAQRIIRENKELAEKARQQMLDKARQESGKLVDEAKSEIEQQKQAALVELRTEVADLAVGAAEVIIRQSLDREKHKVVVDEYIKSMPKSTH